MITNNRQLVAAREKLQQLLEDSREATDPVERRVYEDLAADVAANIREYEEVANGRVRCFFVDSVDDLGSALIRARIARSLSQTDLAEHLGVSPQMVQKDEAREYEVCGLARFAEILDVLGFELVGAVRPKSIIEREPLSPDQTALTTATVVEAVRMQAGEVASLVPTSRAVAADVVSESTGYHVAPEIISRVGS